MTKTAEFRRKFRRAQQKMYRRFDFQKKQSAYTNIYYGCTQKSGSQWFKGVFNDPIFYLYTGLTVEPFKFKLVNEDEVEFHRNLRFTSKFAEKILAAHLYVGYETYAELVKPEAYKTFYILRDPRDIVVSWYFSTKYSHPLQGDIPKRREMLNSLDEEAGLKYAIDEIEKTDLFYMQRSWVEGVATDPNAAIFKYERFAEDNKAFLKELLSYLDVGMPAADFETLASRHAFAKLAQRSQGEEDQQSHYRKGVAGDWKNYFTPEVQAHFEAVTGDLLDVLGYR